MTRFSWVRFLAPWPEGKTLESDGRYWVFFRLCSTLVKGYTLSNMLARISEAAALRLSLRLTEHGHVHG